MRLRSPHDGEIARLAIPALGTLVAEPLYVLADTAIVGHIGTPELAGLALASTVLLAIHGLMIFLAYGTTASVSRLIGADNPVAAARVSLQGMWLAAALGVTWAGVLMMAGDPLLRLLGAADADVLAAAGTYLRVSAAGLPSMLVMLAGAGAFYGRQDTTTPLVVAVGSAGLNLVVELALIPGLGFGIGASALATVVAQTVAAVIYVARILRQTREASLSIRPEPLAMGRLFLTGRALMLRTLALRGAFTVAAALAARIGPAELAAHQIGLQTWSTLALALDAVAIAGQALTGRWLGAGDVARARDAARRMIELDVAVGAIAGVVVFLARGPIARIFSDDPAVIAAAATVLALVAVSEPVNGYVFALDGVLIGAGDLRYLGRAMAASAVAFVGLAAAAVALDTGLAGLWWALTGFMVIRAVTLWWRWRGDRWLVVGENVP
ncbi:MAG: MATE family efflux transporter [Acidimicrobiales bacterium]